MERLIVVIGPTAVGKTNVSIKLANLLHTEIISGDSMLIYRGMNIGTAKPSLMERQGIPHHLIDILEPFEEFNVVEFQRLASSLISDINQKGKIPILAGGTGLYVKALLEGYHFNSASGNEQLRNKLLNLAQEYGNEYLYSLLNKVAPQAANRIHPNDIRRIIRALEIYDASGEAVSYRKSPCLVYDAVVIGLTMNRTELYDRINERVDRMIAGGLVQEVTELLKSGVPPDCQAMQAIGYKEIINYLNELYDLPTAIEIIKKSTRNFAKRQLTLFRRMDYIQWFDLNDYSNLNILLEYIYRHVAQKFFLK